MAKWEYKIVQLVKSGPSIESEQSLLDEKQQVLNTLGDEGWELVSVKPDGNVAYLKRQIRDWGLG